MLAVEEEHIRTHLDLLLYVEDHSKYYYAYTELPLHLILAFEHSDRGA